MPHEPAARPFAIVVTFRPDIVVFRSLLDALLPQVERIIVVDNTPHQDVRVEEVLAQAEFGSVALLRLGSNQGIAIALNVGIQSALSAGATHVLLSDQDSLPDVNMVAALMQASQELVAAGRRVAAVGPVYKDRHTGVTFPFQTMIPGKFFYGHQRASESFPVVDALTLITSGTLIGADVLRDVGPMREDFFIDYVDIEWCHRARSLGYSLYGMNQAVMHHALGDAALRVWYFGWRRESVYSPERVYYRIRNFVALCRLPAIQLRWKVRSSWYLLGFVYSQVTFGKQRQQCLGMAFRGLWDGLFGRMGPRQS